MADNSQQYPPSSTGSPGSISQWSSVHSQSPPGGRRRSGGAAWAVVGVCTVVILLVFVLWLAISNAQRLDNGTASDQVVDNVSAAIADAERAAAQAAAAYDHAAAAGAVDAAQQVEIDALQGQVAALRNKSPVSSSGPQGQRSWSWSQRSSSGRQRRGSMLAQASGDGSGVPRELADHVAAMNSTVDVSNGSFGPDSKPMSEAQLRRMYGQRADISMHQSMARDFIHSAIHLDAPDDHMEVMRRSSGKDSFSDEEFAMLEARVSQNDKNGGACTVFGRPR